MTDVALVSLKANDLPAWAHSFLEENLEDGVKVVNAHVVESGPMKKELLLNTTEGSALLTNPRFGTPSLVRLPLPGRRFSFTCVDCKEQIELLDADMPRPFFCSRCARHYTLSKEGDNYVLFTATGDAEPERKPRGPGWARVDPASPVAKPKRRTATKKKASKNGGKPQSRPATKKGTDPFRYRGYTLHTRNVNLKNGNRQRIYFFSKKNTRGATPTPKPKGYRVRVTATGLPVLQKSRNGSEGASAKAPRKTSKKSRKEATRSRSSKKANQTKKPGGGEDRRKKKTSAKPDKKEHRYQPQCQGLTETGKQCRNSSRDRSKYCSAHFGYRPPRLAMTTSRGTDTVPRVKGAEDTRPSHRRRSRRA